MESTGQEDGEYWDGGDEGAGAPLAEIHGSATAYYTHAEATAMRQQYHECLRNHAAAAGGHVVDGCCEFMAASTEDPLACAACGCHRSFHRRDPSPGRVHVPPLLAAASARVPLSLLPPPASKHPHQHQRLPFAYGPAPSGGTGTTTESSSEERRGPAPAPRKRSRTTFTREQKEQMLAFAERVGWRMQRQDEATVEHFCAQAGVRRQALKVWMHNNKQTSTGRRQQQQQEEEKLREQRQEQQQ